MNQKLQLPVKLASLLILIALLAAPGVGWGQISMTTTGSHTQDFNTLESSGTSNAWTDNSTIANWYWQRTGSGTTYSASTGSINSGNAYSFGASSSSERAMGSVGSGNVAAGNFASGVLLRNTSGQTITDIKITYTGEQWRAENNATQTISFYFKISSTIITALSPNNNSTWTAVTALNFSSPRNNISATLLVGNLAENKVTFSNISIPSLSLAHNDYIMLKWDDPDHSGSDHGLSIDDVTISWTVPGGGSGPILAISGETSHGSVCPNLSANPITYTITNSGTVAAEGISVNSSDPQFVVSNLTSTSIAANGGNATYNVTFTPSSAGAKTTTITVSSTTSGSNSPTSSLTGTGSATIAQTITSSSAGSVTAQGATLNGQVTILGACPTAIERGFVYSVTSTDANPRVGEPGVTKVVVAGINTSAYNLSVTGLLSSTNYTFTSYVYNGTNYNYGSDRTFTTLGALTVSGTTAHGSVCPGVSAPPLTYTITNNGAFLVEGINVVSGGTNAADFVVTGLSSSTISPGGTATYVVTFTPSASGARSAAITVSSTTPGIANATSNLTGTGSTPATAAVTTSAASIVTISTATLNGNLTTLGVCPATTEKGFVYSQTSVNSNPLVDGTGVTKTSISGLTTGAYLLALSSLNSGTEYSYKAYVFDGTTYTYGSVSTFTTVVAAPIAISATSIVATGFTANWEAVQGASSYRLDVLSQIYSASDDFSDNDFTNNPIWSGNTADYSVVTASTLPSGDASTDGFYLGSNSNVGNSGLYISSTEVNEWNFSLGSTSFEPSGSNYFGVVLMSNATFSNVITSSFNGYYLRIGVNSTPDPIELWRSTGTTKTRIGNFPSIPSFSSEALTDGLNIRITRNGSGVFELFYSTGFLFPNTPITSAGTLTDNTHSSSLYFGPYTYFGSPAETRRIYIDNIQLGTGSFVSGYNDFAANAGTSQTVTGLSPNTTYYYRVRAVGGSSTSANSNVISVTTGAIKTTMETGDWNSITWSPAGAPSPIDDVIINHAVNIAGQASCNNLTIGTGSLTIANGGSFIPTGTVTGNVTAIRNIAGLNQYHFLSSPISNAALGDIFPAGDVFNIYMRSYNETTGNWVNLEIPANMTSGAGYSFFMDIASTTATFTGTLNNSNISPVVSNSGNSGNLNYDGWNLLGNPFASAIQWGLGNWALTNINNEVHVWSNGVYLSYAGRAGSLTDGIIPAQQGFFVKANASGPSITIPTAARLHSSQGFYKNNIADLLRLDVSGSTNYSDATFVRFSEDATEGFDAAFDAHKLDNDADAPMLYTMNAEKRFSINTLRSASETPEIPVYFKAGTNGDYTITASGIESFSNRIIYLTDNLTGLRHDLRQNPVYAFSAAAGDDANRFKLSFATVGIEEPSGLNIGVYAAGSQIRLVLPELMKGRVNISNLSGQLLYSQNFNGSGELGIGASYPAGVYLVTVISANGSTTRKVFVN